MDTVSLHADQRFDLVDMQRLIDGVHEALNWITGKTLGNPNYFKGPAEDKTARPLVLHGFNCTAAGLVVTVTRTHTVGTQTFEALIFDKDGYRIAGPNSTASKTLTVPDTGGVQYIAARRIVGGVPATTETRKHYSAALGEYPANIDTEIFDDWEIEDTSVLTGMAVSCSGNTTLRDNGWVDIATLETDGGGNIIALYPFVGVTASDQVEAIANAWITWATSPPDPDRPPLNLFEIISACAQLIKRLRYGAGATSRPLLDDPTYDACFEEEGGVRFAGGTTAVTTLQDAYLRLRGAAWDMLVNQKGSPVDADDLLWHRAQGFLAGGAVGGNETLDPALAIGHCYSSNTANKVASPVHKKAPIPSSSGKPNQIGTPFQSAAHGLWNISQMVTGAPGADISEIAWKVYWNGIGAGAPGRSSVMIWPIAVPNGVRVQQVTMEFELLAPLPNFLDIVCGVRYRKKIGHINGAGVADHTSKIYNNGTAPISGGVGTYVLDMLAFGDTEIVVDNDDDNGVAGEDLFVYMFLDDSSGVGAQSFFKVYSGTVHYKFREASQIYELVTTANRLA